MTHHCHKRRILKQVPLNLNLNGKMTRKQVLLGQMNQVVPWGDLVALNALYYPVVKSLQVTVSLMTMLRIHFMQQWFTLSDPGMEETLFDTPLYREFAQLEEFERPARCMVHPALSPPVVET